MNTMKRNRVLFEVFLIIISLPSVFADPPEDGMLLWLDASRGLRTEGHGQVYFWQDLSSAGNHAEQNREDNRPVVKLNAVNNEPAVYFDGQKSFLSIPGLKIPRDASIFIICQDVEQTKGGSVS